jgi:rhodanese-related sulfurtransferase
MGYDQVYSLKWGMCSWHPNFAGKWTSNIGNSYATQFTTTATEKRAAGDLPELGTGETTGEEILVSRVASVLTEGFDPVKVTAQAVFDNPDNYYIVSYWPADRYADPGHIPEAVQYTPKESIALDADLKTLPADKTIAVYCYTGQTSAYLAAYLRILGYDAKSVLFGANGMIYDILEEKEWTIFDESQIMGYEYWTD